MLNTIRISHKWEKISEDDDEYFEEIDMFDSVIEKYFLNVADDAMYDFDFSHESYLGKGILRGTSLKVINCEEEFDYFDEECKWKIKVRGETTAILTFEKRNHTIDTLLWELNLAKATFSSHNLYAKLYSGEELIPPEYH